jgi:hypothetical protein
MRRWTYLEPGENNEPVKVTRTDAQILDEYYLWWADRMFKIGKGPMVTEANCIDDYVVVHWAELEPE